MTFRIKVEDKDVLKRLDQLEINIARDVERAVELGGQELKGEIIRRIHGGSRSGKVYKRGKTAIHQASAPGEYPKSDTGRLASNIFARAIDRAVVEVGTDIKYGRYLEEGTKRMDPRPWLVRTWEELKPKIMARITRAVNQ